jgi:hypothetical protein
MKWQFWKKAASEEAIPPGKKAKHFRPKDLPFFIGKHLVVNGNFEPDWVWSLKSVSRPIEGTTHKFEIRIFNPARVSISGANIRAFEDLDTRPDLILFNGWYNQASMDFDLREGQTPGEKGDMVA